MKAKSTESNFTRHWVRVRIDGFRPERLISQLAGQGIPMRNIRHKDETEVYLTLPAGGYKKLKKLTKSKYKLTVIEEGGSRPVLQNLRRNKLLAAGVLVFMAVFLLQSSIIKEIQVIGCETIPEDELRAVLKEEGLYEGCRKNFDCDEIEIRLFQEYESIVWAKVSYQGSYVQVEISEGEIQEEEIRNREKPCHLVAEQDCYIEKVYTYKGRSHVAEGDFVKKGGILISGIVPIEHPTYPQETENGEMKENVHYVHAEGKVTARVPYYFSLNIESGSTEAEMEAAIRRWTKENVPESAEILNKDFHFEQKKNIIKLYGIIETRQQVGVEKEIVIDKRQESGNEENTD